MNNATSQNYLFAQCYCAYFQFDSLSEKLLSTHRCTAYNGTLKVEWQAGYLFIFEYGVIVFWNLDINQRQQFIEFITEFAHDIHDDKAHDEFSYETDAELLLIKNDHLMIPVGDELVYLALSHGIAQSTKLAQFERQVQNTINNYADIPLKIAESGSSQLSSKQIAKLRGRLFIAKSDIMLNYDLLDIPEFFWEYPELEPVYKRIANYLEVQQRIEVLSKKLETIHELFEMMADEQKHKHSSMLEWIIIWLIALEIIVFLFHDIFKLF